MKNVERKISNYYDFNYVVRIIGIVLGLHIHKIRAIHSTKTLLIGRHVDDFFNFNKAIIHNVRA